MFKTMRGFVEAVTDTFREHPQKFFDFFGVVGVLLALMTMVSFFVYLHHDGVEDNKTTFAACVRYHDPLQCKDPKGYAEIEQTKACEAAGNPATDCDPVLHQQELIHTCMTEHAKSSLSDAQYYCKHAYDG